MHILPFILGIILFEGCAQSCIKKGHETCNMNYCYLAIVFYAIVVALLYKTYNYDAMGIVNAIWSGLSVLSIIVIGAIFYHETVNFWDYLGIIFILIGIFFIFIKGHTNGK